MESTKLDVIDRETLKIRLIIIREEFRGLRGLLRVVDLWRRSGRWACRDRINECTCLLLCTG